MTTRTRLARLGVIAALALVACRSSKADSGSTTGSGPTPDGPVQPARAGGGNAEEEAAKWSRPPIVLNRVSLPGGGEYDASLSLGKTKVYKYADVDRDVLAIVAKRQFEKTGFTIDKHERLDGGATTMEISMGFEGMIAYGVLIGAPKGTTRPSTLMLIPREPKKK